ncbi:MAG: glycosyltransferase family 4 protein, partial [Deltaproteobacteria bacterium]|nr:glycosyltransferase family 4 protein [Deltaproteobacteria bacterium]
KVLVLRPDVILAFLRRLAVVSVIIKTLLRRKETRIIISDDTITSLSLHHETKNLLKRSFVFRLMKKYYPGADLIVSPSGTSKQDLVETFGIPEDKIVVNRNWVTNWTRETHTTKIYDMIYVGRVDPEKDIGSMLDIMSEVAGSVSSFRACIVGNGARLPNIRDLLGTDGLGNKVELTGAQRDVNRFLDRAKVFCLTSRYEGFPIAAIEAMARGLPVVTTAYPGADELVRQGETGYICESRAEYVERVTSLIEDDAERIRMGERAREYARTHHGAEALKLFAGLFMDGRRPQGPPAGTGG